MSLVWLDGRMLEGSAATIGVADRGFLYGDGLFETMRGRGKRVFRIEAHLARLRRGAERLAIPVPAGIETAIAELLGGGGLADSALRLTLTRGPGDAGLQPPPDPRPTLAISLRPAPVLPAALYERGLSAQLSAHRLGTRSATAGIKAIGYLPNILALAEARSAGADEALLLNERDEVVEASASNVFWLGPDGELRTPASACGILPGITRSVVLGLARSWRMAVREGAWGPSDLAGAREAFATSSLRGIAPITTLAGKPIGDGRVGPLTRRVMQEYGKLLERETD